MQQKFNFDYDPENDSLFIYDPKSKSKASIEMDYLIIDYNANKKICAIEFLNASEFLEEVESHGEKININNLLLNLKECKIEVLTKKGFNCIKLVFVSKSKEIFATPLVIPSVAKPSPALAKISS